jgi:hypothetical protein
VEWLVIVVLGVVAYYWFKSKTAKKAQSIQRAAQPVVVPEVKVTFTTSFSRSNREAEPPRDVGELIGQGDGVWVLNPKSPLPLTVVGAERPVAEQLKALLGTAEYWSQKIPDIALVIAQHNLRFREVDVFVKQYRGRFDAEVARLTAASSEWNGATEKDRVDLRTEFEEKALESLGISVGRADFGLLLAGQPSDFSEDDQLVRLFAGDATLYSFYLTQLGRSATVVNVKADDYGRKSWEQLVDKGLARRGRDIPMQLLLEGMKLKELNELLVGVVPKPLGRKAKAVEAALALPDLQDRLSARISFREMFEAMAPSDLDVQKLVESFRYSTALAAVVQQTYYTAIKTLDAVDERRRESGIYDAWEITNWEDPVPPCAATVCRKYDRLPAKKPPFHVGCTCQLACAFKD